MLTTYEEEDMILKALCAGACSYISKKARLEEIVDALRIVAAGGSYMSPSIARKLYESPDGRACEQGYYFIGSPKRNTSEND